MKTVRELHHSQAVFDAAYWEHPPGWPTVEHAYFHLMSLTAELARRCQDTANGSQPDWEFLRYELIPELIMYALRLANQFDLESDEIDRMVARRWAELSWRLGPEKVGFCFGNPPGCTCDDRHRSSVSCPNTAASHGAIKDTETT